MLKQLTLKRQWILGVRPLRLLIAFTALDLLGTTPDSVSVDRLVVFGLLSVLLLMAAFSGRRMQLARS